MQKFIDSLRDLLQGSKQKRLAYVETCEIQQCRRHALRHLHRGRVLVRDLHQQPLAALGPFLVGLYLLFATKVVDQWEKVAMLRFGQYIGLRGPGLFFIIPVVDTLSRFVDQRVRVANVTAESTLTRDTVPVNVDAIVFWMVWNAEKSILEVENFITPSP